MTPTAKAGLGLILLALAMPLLLYWGYNAFEKEQLHDQLFSIAKDTSTRFREALEIEVNPPSDPDTIDAKLRAHHARTDQYLAQLRDMQPRSLAGIREAAVDYVLTCREILRMQVANHAAERPLVSSIRALREHMRGNPRAPQWVQGAVRAKENLDRDYREYRRATETFLSLLETFPASQAKLAPHVDKSVLIDERLYNEARQKAAAAFAQITNEVKKFSRLENYR